ncbi:hypothetical protein SCHPADRAFT_888972 [Schizopora paradoxa]|uniref:Fungal-type protein kinase domain-containing protein n=1 Tax=Schizopora paradoxa TaxID=27342 RepID=A0A0H2RS27_9AGAM|nr:hypothetical protein SCHPADRAFT_888972 [Schizopora paradoxa]
MLDFGEGRLFPRRATTPNDLFMNYDVVSNDSTPLLGASELSTVRVPFLCWSASLHPELPTDVQFALQRNAPEDGRSPSSHCVILSTARFHLWEYDSEEDLFYAFISVLETHKKLHEKGGSLRTFSSRDIIMAEGLDAENSGPEVFILDFEFARFKGGERTRYVGANAASAAYSETSCETPGDSESVTSSGSTHEFDLPSGDFHTGTFQFMASDLLHLVSEERTPKSKAHISIRQGMHHELESLVLVFGHILLRRAIRDKSSSYYDRLSGKTALGRYSISDIQDQRKRLALWKWVFSETLVENTSPKLVKVAEMLRGKMQRLLKQRREDTSRESVDDEDENVILAHDSLIDLFEEIAED